MNETVGGMEWLVKLRVTAHLREILVGLAAVCAGLGVAYVDSRPTWDDTGVTAGVVSFLAAASSAIAGRRPWLWALLVGAWTPVLEIPLSRQYASLLVLVFAAAGAALGYGVVRALRPGTGTQSAV